LGREKRPPYKRGKRKKKKKKKKNDQILISHLYR
jgi:hypothetical protein